MNRIKCTGNIITKVWPGYNASNHGTSSYNWSIFTNFELVTALKDFISENPGPLAITAEEGLVKLEKYENELEMEKSKIP